MLGRTYTLLYTYICHGHVFATLTTTKIRVYSENKQYKCAVTGEKYRGSSSRDPLLDRPPYVNVYNNSNNYDNDKKRGIIILYRQWVNRVTNNNNNKKK